jgi:hypothetical protein
LARFDLWAGLPHFSALRFAKVLTSTSRQGAHRPAAESFRDLCDKAVVAHAAAVGKRARVCETHDYFRVFQLRIIVVLAFGCIT